MCNCIPLIHIHVGYLAIKLSKFSIQMVVLLKYISSFSFLFFLFYNLIYPGKLPVNKWTLQPTIDRSYVL